MMPGIGADVFSRHWGNPISSVWPIGLGVMESAIVFSVLR